MHPLLDNILWNSLKYDHAHFSSGTEHARRYARGFSPILGFADPKQPDFAAIAAYCDPGEHFYCADWAGAMPAGWQLDAEATMFRMVYTGAMPLQDMAPDAVPLTAEHAEQALALAQLTNPGPFGLRTIELGDYFGYFENGKLIAMAGERMHAGTLREVSGVCTHPDHQGRGYARRLIDKLLRRQLQRGQLPFLHVMSGNHSAHALYLRMGFIDHHEPVVRVVSLQS